MRSRVAIVACRAAPGAADLYPDADRPFLASALDDAGVDAIALPWDDAGVDWSQFAVAVIRSTWNSVDRPAEYLSWARRVAGATALVNPLPAIEWGFDKTYLPGLAARGVPVVPTEWVVDASDWTPPTSVFVIKPSISGGGRETAHYRPDQAPAAEAHVRRVLAAGKTVMVQPHLASVDEAGETKLIFLDGTFSHAVRVGQQLAAGAGVPERPWERLGHAERADPTSGQLAAAEAVLAAVDAEVASPCVYVRVDLVAGAGGEPLLNEVEVVDPSLFLRFSPPAARRLAEAVRGAARR